MAFLAIAVNKALTTLCEELQELKQSYFSEEGKEGWTPLKPKTIKNKRVSSYSQNAYKFNTFSGDLRDSITINYKMNVSNSQIKSTVIVNAQHDKGDSIIEYLIDTLGRDFLRFDNKEKQFIKTRFYELLRNLSIPR